MSALLLLLARQAAHACLLVVVLIGCLVGSKERRGNAADQVELLLSLSGCAVPLSSVSQQLLTHLLCRLCLAPCAGQCEAARCSVCGACEEGGAQAQGAVGGGAVPRR